MASSIQLLRSATTQERPTASNLLDGQPAVNTNATEPGLFFKASDGSLVKVGPTAITTDGAPPNASATGSTGNSIGEMWLDKSLDPPVLKVYDGTAWVNAGSGSGGGGNVTLLRWTKTAVGGETSLSGPDDASQPLNYTPGLEQLYLNGVLLERGTDYIGTNGTAFTSLSPLTAGDVVMALAYSPVSVGAIDASVVAYSPSGTGAVERTVEARLKDFVCVTDFIPNGTNTATTDCQPFIQNAINHGLASGKAVYLPSGTYRVESKLTINIVNESFRFYGDTIESKILASSFTGPVIEVIADTTFRWTISTIETISVWSEADAKVSGQYGIQMLKPRAAALTLKDVSVRGFDVGYWLETTQFCTFTNILGAVCNVGLYLTPDLSSPGSGGGNSNSFYDCKFNNNQVGVAVMADLSLNWPFGAVSFYNPITQSNSVCPFYCFGVSQISIDQWNPEGNGDPVPPGFFTGSGPASYVFQGKTILSSILHLEKSRARISDFDHVSKFLKIICQQDSVLHFDGRIGNDIVDCDSTSYITHSDASAVLYNGRTSIGVYGTAPSYVVGGASYSCLALPKLTASPWLGNEALTIGGKAVLTGYSNTSTASTQYVTDAEMGSVQQVDFSSDGQFSISNLSSVQALTGETLAVSLLIQSSNPNAIYTANLTTNTCNKQITVLPQDSWVRLILHGEVINGPKVFNLRITADNASSEPSSLRICRFQANRDLPPYILQAFFKDGLFNRGIKDVPYLSSSPSAGAWELGDIAYNSSPTAGGFIGWVCVSAGTPGTWKTFGAISP